MKNGLENIDKIIKQAFDGFESNVDPSVWNNIQNSIASGSSGTSTPKVDPSTVAGIAGKSLAVKIIAGVALLGTVATSVYFIPNLFKDKEAIASEKIVADNLVPTKITNELAVSSVVEDQHEILNKKVDIKAEDKNLIIKSSAIERKSVISEEHSENNESTPIMENQKNSNSSDNQIANEKVTANKTTPVTQNSVKVNPPTEFSVKINVDVIKGKAPLTVQFDAYGEGAEQYFWDFRDESAEVNEESPIHTFLNDGTYRVKLSGINKEGNSKDAYTTIIVEKDYSSSIQQPLQNVFSPNGDGENDFIKIRGKNIDEIQVKITDSKGKIVFVMNSLDDMWEGKDQNGNYLVQGQYFMTIVAIGKDKENHILKQVVNLLN